MAEVTLYHGSVSVIKKPVFGKANRTTTMGAGFIARSPSPLPKNGREKEIATGMQISMRLI